jgi:hypothetical protein
MKSKTITLRVHVTTEDGEVLEAAQVVTELDLSARIDTGGNAKRANTGGAEAASLFEDALRIAFVRARKEAGL